MQTKNIVYFSLETQRSLGEVRDYGNKDRMNVSVAVTYSTTRGTYQIYHESEGDRLGEELIRADLVVGWNSLYFDYQVLQPYVFHTLVEQTNNLDMMVELVVLLESAIDLNSVALASLGIENAYSSLDALRLWRIHRKTGDTKPLHELAECCTQKVKTIKLLHEYAIEKRLLKYYNTKNLIDEVLVDWRDFHGHKSQWFNGINGLLGLCSNPAPLNVQKIARIMCIVTGEPIEKWFGSDEDAGFVYPPESLYDHDNDCDFDYEEADREREQLITDAASDADDFSRSDEEGWYYPDQQNR